MALFKKRVTSFSTLVIESTDVRFLVVENGSVQRYGTRPLTGDTYVDGLVTNAVKMGDIVREVVSENALDPNHTITSISGLRAIPRVMTLPNIQANMLREAISREARKEMPVSLEDLYLSWQAAELDDERQRIFLLGVPKEMVDAHIRTLEAAGVKPWVMDLKPLALARAVRQEQAIIVNLERDSLDILLVVDHWPAIMRCFSFDRDEFQDDQARLDRMLNETSQTIRFYDEGHRSNPLRPDTGIFVTGRYLRGAEPVRYVRGVIDRPIEVPPAPIPCPVDLPAADYMTNLGLALKEV